MKAIGWTIGFLLDVTVTALGAAVAMKVDFSYWLKQIEVLLIAH